MDGQGPFVPPKVFEKMLTENPQPLVHSTYVLFQVPAKEGDINEGAMQVDEEAPIPPIMFRCIKCASPFPFLECPHPNTGFPSLKGASALLITIVSREKTTTSQSQ